MTNVITARDALAGDVARGLQCAVATNEDGTIELTVFAADGAASVSLTVAEAALVAAELIRRTQ